MIPRNELRARLEELDRKATPGPWRSMMTGRGMEVFRVIEGSPQESVCRWTGDHPERVRNLDLIVALRNALPDILAAPPEGWQVVRDAHPKPHARYLVRRNGVVYTATPCYGMHEPWWAPQQLTATSKREGDPVAMLDTDEWCSSEESSALRALAAAPLPPSETPDVHAPAIAARRERQASEGEGMETSALIEALRSGPGASLDYGIHLRKYQNLCNRAADALARQSAEIAALTRQTVVAEAGRAVAEAALADLRERVRPLLHTIAGDHRIMPTQMRAARSLLSSVEKESGK